MQWLRICFFLACSLALFARENAPAEINALSVSGLQSELAKHVSQPSFARAAWGVKIVSIDSGKVLFEHAAEKLLKPASNAKLFTGALALDRLDPDSRIRTSAFAKTKPTRAGTLESDLIIYGRGDPSFAARFRDGNYNDLLQPLAKAIAAAGVRVIAGDLVGDETFFTGPPYGSSWTWDDLQYYYGAEISALTVQDNVIDLILKPGERAGEPCLIVTKPATEFVQLVNRTVTVSSNSSADISVHRPLGQNIAYITGHLPLLHAGVSDSVTVSKPAGWFLAMLKQALAEQGVQVKGRLRTVAWPEHPKSNLSDLAEIAGVNSAPLSELVTKMMKPSQNLYAQLLLLQVGAAVARPQDTNTWTEDLGLRELRDFITKVGISRSEVLLEEGSGLSRGALVSPNALVKLLLHMRRHRHSQLFLDSLPIAGVDGTLRNRLRRPGLKENIRAKTGTIRYVNALSGYMQTAAGENLAFAIMLNAYNSPSGASRDQVDYIPALLWRLTEKTERK
jgi:D-alanyl-D-alanine carboxypeptidase/D-alanyl-D-alanine-endopeptidase (penicillin-binding protein 4)